MSGRAEPPARLTPVRPPIPSPFSAQNPLEGNRNPGKGARSRTEQPREGPAIRSRPHRTRKARLQPQSFPGWDAGGSPFNRCFSKFGKLSTTSDSIRRNRTGGAAAATGSSFNGKSHSGAAALELPSEQSHTKPHHQCIQTSSHHAWKRLLGSPRPTQPTPLLGCPSVHIPTFPERLQGW